MNLFDRNPGRLPDQDDLIAYHLRELSPKQERAVRRALKTNTALAAESIAIAETLLAFPKTEPTLPIDASTLNRHWQALRPSLPLHFPRPSARRNLLRRWTIPALAASALAATALFFAIHHHQSPPPTTIATIATPSETALTPSPSTPSNSALSSGMQYSASAPHPWIINQPWSPSSAPFETETETAAPTTAPEIARPSPSVLPAEPLGPVTPTESSSAATDMASTADTTPLPPTTPPPTRGHASHGILRSHTTDVTLAIFADLTANNSSTTTSGTGASLITKSNSQTASPAVGALASFHQQFRPWLGYRATATYFHPSFEYANNTSTSSGTYSSGPSLVNTLVYEFAGTYVVQGPHRQRFTTSVEAGASLLAFVPNPTQSQTSSIRPAAIVGVGAEYSLTKRFSLHAEYRAQIYKGPAFSDTNNIGTFASTSTTFSSNPILGITYHFGKTGND